MSSVVYTYSEEGDVKLMMGTHVDDILFACKPGYENFVRKLQEAFQVEDSKVSEGNFRFCGREISQEDDGSITVKSTAEKRFHIELEFGRLNWRMMLKSHN